MKPDLDAIRARWKRCSEESSDIPALLAYIDELEAAWRNERETFASCNRARQHCERECEDLRKLLPPINADHEAIVDGMLAKSREGVAKRPIGTYSPGEIEWANRIAHAEQRFVDEYDARKAAERQVEELKARIVTLEAMR